MCSFYFFYTICIRCCPLFFCVVWFACVHATLCDEINRDNKKVIIINSRKRLVAESWNGVIIVQNVSFVNSRFGVFSCQWRRQRKTAKLHVRGHRRRVVGAPPVFTPASRRNYRARSGQRPARTPRASTGLMARCRSTARAYQPPMVDRRPSDWQSPHTGSTAAAAACARTRRPIW